MAVQARPDAVRAGYLGDDRPCDLSRTPGRWKLALMVIDDRDEGRQFDRLGGWLRDRCGRRRRVVQRWQRSQWNDGDPIDAVEG
jgi:hypothetical protein